MCGKLSYTLTYEGGATVQTGDMLYAKDYVTTKVTLSYAEFNDASLLATADVAISNLGITINYQQSGSALVKDNGEVANNRVYHQGEKITLNNEDYYIIADSGADKDYVVALKDLPLIYNEVNDASTGVNISVTNRRGFGVVSYYTSDTCNASVHSDCNSNYDELDIKLVVNNWALSKFTNNELKEVSGYKARLITVSEYNNISTNFSWRCSEGYLTMTPFTGWANSFSMITTGCGVARNDIWYPNPVRPVINVYKSALEINNNSNNNE